MADSSLEKVIQILRQNVSKIEDSAGLTDHIDLIYGALDKIQKKLKAGQESQGTGATKGNEHIGAAIKSAQLAKAGLTLYAKDVWEWERKIGEANPVKNDLHRKIIDSDADSGKVSHESVPSVVANVKDEATSLNSAKSYAANHLDKLFARHSELFNDLRADQREFEEIAFQYGETYLGKFGGKILTNITQRIEKKGASKEKIARLRNLIGTIHTRRMAVKQVAEYIGECGGMHFLESRSFFTPLSFWTSAQGKSPGRSHVDGLALAISMNEIIIPEFKGATSKYNPRKNYVLRHLDPSLTAPQGSPAYVMDRMLNDDRVIRYFCGNPSIWQSVKEGRTKLTTAVYETPIGKETRQVHSESFSPWPNFIVKMEKRFANLNPSTTLT